MVIFQIVIGKIFVAHEHISFQTICPVIVPQILTRDTTSFQPPFVLLLPAPVRGLIYFGAGIGAMVPRTRFQDIY